MKKLSLIALTALALSACSGGGDSNGGVNNGGGDSGTPATPTIDAFVTYVMGLIGVSDETSSPIAVEAVVATAPENTEPVAVK
ncbi:hypothetical protein [Rugamonas sp.]|uniref:hypothetical protein n=1 Tax=Rugamonas sp. TaxID=1926287 RepID=UPI0025D56D44|nr:hypothetical protein [Rugamonas sp.]